MKKRESDPHGLQSVTGDRTVTPESSPRHEHLAYLLGRFPLELRRTAADGYESLFFATHRPGIPEIDRIELLFAEIRQIAEYLRELLPSDSRDELTSAVLHNVEEAVKSYVDACSMYAELYYVEGPELLAYLNGKISFCTEGDSGLIPGYFDHIKGDFAEIGVDSARQAEEDGDDMFIERAIHERLMPFRFSAWDELFPAVESFCEALPEPLACMATIGRTLSSIEDGRVGAPIITVGGGKTFQTELANSSPLILQVEGVLAEFQATHSGTEHLEVRFVGQSARRQGYDRNVSDWVDRVHEQLMEYFENAPIRSPEAVGANPTDDGGATIESPVSRSRVRKGRRKSETKPRRDKAILEAWKNRGNKTARQVAKELSSPELPVTYHMVNNAVKADRRKQRGKKS